MGADKQMIKIAIIGVGNCASSLVQGLSYCREFRQDTPGLLFPELGGYTPEDIEVVAAFDIDRRKVDKPLSEAVFALPNNTLKFFPGVKDNGVTVSRGRILDGVSLNIRNQPVEKSFSPIEAGESTREDVIAILKNAGAEIIINFLPVGSQEASEFYASCALEAGVAFINAIPVFLASNAKWADKFKAAGLPLLGDDFKAQMGATITHRNLVNLFNLRGAEIDRSYQLNVGGNTDFLNMMDMERLATKRVSKTESVQSAAKARFKDTDLRVGPSDYVPWLDDQKVAFIRVEGRLFGGAPVNVEMRLSVEDSPNAAVMALAAIRCARLALDRKTAGIIPDASAFLFKHPPEQMEDHIALDKLLAFAKG